MAKYWTVWFESMTHFLLWCSMAKYWTVVIKDIYFTVVINDKILNMVISDLFFFCGDEWQNIGLL